MATNLDHPIPGGHLREKAQHATDLIWRWVRLVSSPMDLGSLARELDTRSRSLLSAQHPEREHINRPAHSPQAANHSLAPNLEVSEVGECANGLWEVLEGTTLPATEKQSSHKIKA